MIIHPSYGILAVGLAAVLSAGACSSAVKPSAGPAPRPTSPRPTSSFASSLAKQQRLYPVFVQCLARQGIPVWDRAQGKMDVAQQGTKEGWYTNGKVTPNDAFWIWFREHDGTYAYSPALRPYKTIDDWVAGAVKNGAWPAKVCGPLPSPSANGS